MKILKAIYKNGKLNKEVHAIEISHSEYVSKFRGKLYCTEENCSAMLSFVERKKTNLKYFRTWSKSKHKEGCPNEVSYHDEKYVNGISGEYEKLYFSDSHISDSLRRMFEKLTVNGEMEPSKDKKKSRKVTNSVVSENSNIKGVLFEEKYRNPGKKEPYILTRNIENLDDADVDEIRCVFGNVKHMALFDDYGYINFRNTKESNVKVHFSKFFTDKNEAQYNDFDRIKDYIDVEKKHGDVICCCVGRVRKVKKGYNIHPDRTTGFEINGKNYYDILRNTHNMY